MKHYGPRTSIKDIPVCNERLYREVAQQHKLDPTHVREITDFVGQYIAQVMRAGQMEGVMVPHFGKFRPKEKVVKTIAKVKANRTNGMDILYKAMKGKNVPKLNNPTNETI